jgi:hypothetical protein
MELTVLRQAMEKSAAGAVLDKHPLTWALPRAEQANETTIEVGQIWRRVRPDFAMKIEKICFNRLSGHQGVWVSVSKATQYQTTTKGCNVAVNWFDGVFLECSETDLLSFLNQNGYASSIETSSLELAA